MARGATCHWLYKNVVEWESHNWHGHPRTEPGKVGRAEHVTSFV